MTIRVWNIEEMTGYKPITTLYEDFSIADAFGAAAVKDTYTRALQFAKDSGYKELTELVLVLNWKIWEHYNQKEEKLAGLYDKLWKQVDEYAMNNLKEDELSYYFSTTD